MMQRAKFKAGQKFKVPDFQAQKEQIMEALGLDEDAEYLRDDFN